MITTIRIEMAYLKNMIPIGSRAYIVKNQAGFKACLNSTGVLLNENR